MDYCINGLRISLYKDTTFKDRFEVIEHENNTSIGINKKGEIKQYPFGYVSSDWTPFTNWLELLVCTGVSREEILEYLNGCASPT